MTDEQVALINRTFAALLPVADDAAAHFYARLFAINPQVAPLFSSDLKAQGRKLMQTVGTAVSAARNLQAIREPLEALARRHAGYGVQARHFDDVGVALIEALERTLGSFFTPDARQAWIALYGELVAIMLPALQDEPVGDTVPQALVAEPATGEAAPHGLRGRVARWLGRDGT